MTDDLRALLGLGQLIHAPGVFDPLSARLAIRAGHRAVHLSGAALAAGRPGAELLSGYEIADRAATLAPVLGGVPLLADAGVGFDDPDQAVWTGLALARAGVSGLCLPYGPAISALAGQVPQLTLIVTIDMYAVRRAAADGAHVVIPGGVRDPSVLARLASAIPGVPLAVERPEAAATTVTDAALAEAGVRLVLHPMTALLAAMRAASVTYREIFESGHADRVDRLPAAAVRELVAEFEDDPADHIDT
jgi:2-methylisocitrate lyase-like PEP mutase family enzyme